MSADGRAVLDAVSSMTTEGYAVGEHVLAAQALVPAWLRTSGHVSSDAKASVTILGGPSWVGDGGSACLRSVMIAAARCGRPAIMVRHDPRAPGYSGRDPLCMTFAYAAHLQRHSIDLGFSRAVIVHWLGVLPPDEWGSASPDCEMPSERAHGRACEQELAAFLCDPRTVTGPTMISWEASP